jgi:hypothetical protein
VVLADCNGTRYKFDNLNQGNSGTFCHPSGLPVATVWIKAGCFLSGQGPGYGRRFDAPCDYCQSMMLMAVGGNLAPGKESFDVTVYPNPTKDEFTLMVNTGSNSTINASLYDLMGNKILDMPDIQPNLPYTINHPLAQGIYLIRIEHNGTWQSMRLIRN